MEALSLQETLDVTEFITEAVEVEGAAKPKNTTEHGLDTPHHDESAESFQFWNRDLTGTVKGADLEGVFNPDNTLYDVEKSNSLDKMINSFLDVDVSNLKNDQ